MVQSTSSEACLSVLVKVNEVSLLSTGTGRPLGCVAKALCVASILCRRDSARLREQIRTGENKL